MAKPLTAEDRISNKLERYKARKTQWDVLQCLPYAPVEGMPPNLFWGQKVAAGVRPDNSKWIVTLDEDNPTNNIAVEYGGRVREGVVALVIHVGCYDEYGANPRLIGRIMPWAFGGDKFEYLKTLVQNNLDAFRSLEIMVRCSPSKEEQYQELMMQICPEHMRMLPHLKSNPQLSARLQAEWPRAIEGIRDFLKPDTRQEQIAIIQGQQQGGAGAPMGQAPAGFQMQGLPPGARPQFAVGQNPGGFHPPATMPPAAPPIPGFAAPGQAPGSAMPPLGGGGPPVIPPGYGQQQGGPFAPPPGRAPAYDQQGHMPPPASPPPPFGGPPQQPFGQPPPQQFGGPPQHGQPGFNPAPQGGVQPRVENPDEVLDIMMKGGTPPPQNTVDPADQQRAAAPREDVPF